MFEFGDKTKFEDASGILKKEIGFLHSQAVPYPIGLILSTSPHKS